MEYWKKLNPDGTMSTVEGHSFPHKVPDAVEITKEEFDEFIASLPEPEPPEPTRDYGAEIDELRQDNILLKAEIEKLKEDN